MSFPQSRLNLFLKLLSKYNFSGYEFYNPKIISEKDSEYIEFKYKNHEEYKFSWKMVQIGHVTNTTSRVIYFPYTRNPLDEQNKVHENEVQATEWAINLF